MKINEQSAVLKLKEELNKNIKIIDYCVFGSKARGDDTEDSDIDVMIEVEDYTPEIESLIDDIIFEINLAHDCLISAVIFGSKEVEEGPLKESPIYRSIRKDGIRV